MPTSRSTRRARHEQSSAPRTRRGLPNPNSGSVGDQAFTQNEGGTLVHLVKGDTGWKQMGSSTADVKGDAAGVVVVTSTTSAGGDGGGGTTTIANNSITLPLIQQVATDTILGRTSANTGNVESLTATQAAAVIAEADSADNDPDLFLSGTGIFREVSLGAGSISSLTDTVLQSLSDGDLLSLYEPN